MTFNEQAWKDEQFTDDSKTARALTWTAIVAPVVGILFIYFGIQITTPLTKKIIIVIGGLAVATAIATFLLTGTYAAPQTSVTNKRAFPFVCLLPNDNGTCKDKYKDLGNKENGIYENRWYVDRSNHGADLKRKAE